MFLNYSKRMKKLLTKFLLFIFISIAPTVLAQDVIENECNNQCTQSSEYQECNECVKSTEAMANPNPKAPCSIINSTENFYIIAKGNVIKVAFECKFKSECVKEGECIYFTVPRDITTECGTLILPMNSKFSGYIRGISSQKKFNKNARIYISLNKLTLPDGTELEVKAKPFSKDFSLVENGWMTAGKLTASTLGLGAIGTGAGAGLAFIPKPHKIAIGAAAIGLPVGAFIGLVTGLVTPGLKYHAKQGEEIKIIFCDDLCIPKCHINEF